MTLPATLRLDDTKLPQARQHAAAPAPGPPLVLERVDLKILRLTALGRRNMGIARSCHMSTNSISLRMKLLSQALRANSREHLASLSTVYGLVNSEHLNCHLLLRRPPVTEEDQPVLNLLVGGLGGTRIAERLKRERGEVYTAISRLLRRFRVENRCQLAVLAVVTDAVTCDTVSPRFPAIPHSSLPPFDLAPVTNGGMLLHNTPPQPAGCTSSTAPANWRRVRIASPSHSAAVFTLAAASRPSSHPSSES